MHSRLLTPLLLLGLCLPAAAQNTPIQNAPAPVVAGPDAFATIDPGALKLLARLADKYEHLGYFAGVVEVRYGEAAKARHLRFRLSAAQGDTGIISKADERGIERWISDGRVIRATASRRPKQYIEQPLSAGGFWRIGREDFFMRAGFEGILQELLVGQLGGLLLQPDLRSVTVEPTTENGATQKVVVAMASTEKPDAGDVTFFIDDALLLRRATMHEKVNNGTEGIWDEMYSETVIAKDSPAGYYESFTSAPPKGYKRVETFDPGPYATPPVPIAAPPVTAAPRIPAKLPKK